jgi:hypothetical protein
MPPLDSEAFSWSCPCSNSVISHCSPLTSPKYFLVPDSPAILAKILDGPCEFAWRERPPRHILLPFPESDRRTKRPNHRSLQGTYRINADISDNQTSRLRSGPTNWLFSRKICHSTPARHEVLPRVQSLPLNSPKRSQSEDESDYSRCPATIPINDISLQTQTQIRKR